MMSILNAHYASDKIFQIHKDADVQKYLLHIQGGTICHSAILCSTFVGQVIALFFVQ